MTEEAREEVMEEAREEVTEEEMEEAAEKVREVVKSGEDRGLQESSEEEDIISSSLITS